MYESAVSRLRLLRMLVRRYGSLSVGHPENGMCSRVYKLKSDRSRLIEQSPIQSSSAFMAIYDRTGLLGRVTSNLYRRYPVNVQARHFCSTVDEQSIEKDAERKIGWLLKTLFFGTASVVAYNLFPYMGENVLQQSVSLLHVKDPLFKRMGASRLARIAIDDNKRMKVVELGGAKELLNMLAFAKDDRTRKEALKALVAISKSDAAANALHEAGAITVIQSSPDSAECNDIEVCKSALLNRFRELRYDVSN